MKYELDIDDILKSDLKIMIELEITYSTEIAVENMERSPTLYIMMMDKVLRLQIFLKSLG